MRAVKAVGVPVTGYVTSRCVCASIINAFSPGFRVQVPEDCVGDQDQVAHDQNLKDVERRYADKTTADAMIQQFDTWRQRNHR